jgi:environmental stress-induced protein Ves
MAGTCTPGIVRKKRMTHRFTLLDPAGFRESPWKNGGGVTLDIAESSEEGVSPGTWDGLIWRFGRTAISVPGPFSDLTGFERRQMVVKGSGLVLETPDSEIDERRPFSPVCFQGETQILSRLEAGAVDVVNLMGNRQRTRIDLQVLELKSERRLPAGIHILYAADEPCAFVFGDSKVRHDLGQGHAVRIDLDGTMAVAALAGRMVLASVFLV